jgi:hypothetical protein
MLGLLDVLDAAAAQSSINQDLRTNSAASLDLADFSLSFTFSSSFQA